VFVLQGHFWKTGPLYIQDKAVRARAPPSHSCFKSGPEVQGLLHSCSRRSRTNERSHIYIIHTGVSSGCCIIVTRRRILRSSAKHTFPMSSGRRRLQTRRPSGPLTGIIIIIIAIAVLVRLAQRNDRSSRTPPA